MQYNHIGRTGLKVSNICFGTMAFGSFNSEKEAFMLLDACFDAGINFFDTAEMYPVPIDNDKAGLSEVIIGKWLKTKDRTSVIIATKVCGASNNYFEAPVRHGLNSLDRFHIRQAVEDSLRKLGTDYIDLYQTHWVDEVIPVKHTLEVLDELIKEGKIRYFGVSNETSYGLMKSLYTSYNQNLVRAQSIQNSFSLLNPRFLDELAEVCKKEQVSLLPYGPIAGGVLSGKYNNTIPANSRFGFWQKHSSPRYKKIAKRYLNDKTIAFAKRFSEIALQENVHPVTLAIAWTLKFDFIPSSITGATDLKQLKPILAATDYKISDNALSAIKALSSEILYPMG